MRQVGEALWSRGDEPTVSSDRHCTTEQQRNYTTTQQHNCSTAQQHNCKIVQQHNNTTTVTIKMPHSQLHNYSTMSM